MESLVRMKVTEGRGPADLKPAAVAENQAIWRLYLDGAVRETRIRGDDMGAAFQLEPGDADEARVVAGTLPVVAASLPAATPMPLGPVRSLEILLVDPLQG